jgi:hypothetical protein
MFPRMNSRREFALGTSLSCGRGTTGVHGVTGDGSSSTSGTAASATAEHDVVTAEVAIPNVTDGHAGATPDIGAIIDGRPTLQRGAKP